MNRSKKFKVEENEYEITFPTVGQYIKIEELKDSLTNGHFKDFVSSGILSSIRAANIVNCIAIINVLCPNLIKDLKPGLRSLTDLDMLDFAKFLKIYLAEILPWYSKWFESFTKVLEDAQNEVEK